MEDLKRLIELRIGLKKKKPRFVRQEGIKKKKLGVKWRKPMGMHSKLRRMLRGHPARVEPGWGSPAKAKGLSKEGLRKVVVHNIAELGKLDSKKEGAVISSNVGTRNRVEMVRKAQELGIMLLNIKAEKYLAAFESRQKEKAEKKSKESKEKETKQKEKEKKAAEKEKKEKETAADEKTPAEAGEGEASKGEKDQQK